MAAGALAEAPATIKKKLHVDKHSSVNQLSFNTLKLIVVTPHDVSQITLTTQQRRTCAMITKVPTLLLEIHAIL